MLGTQRRQGHILRVENVLDRDFVQRELGLSTRITVGLCGSSPPLSPRLPVRDDLRCTFDALVTKNKAAHLDQGEHLALGFLARPASGDSARRRVLEFIDLAGEVRAP